MLTHGQDFCHTKSQGPFPPPPPHPPFQLPPCCSQPQTSQTKPNSTRSSLQIRSASVFSRHSRPSVTNGEENKEYLKPLRRSEKYSWPFEMRVAPTITSPTKTSQPVSENATSQRGVITGSARLKMHPQISRASMEMHEDVIMSHLSFIYHKTLLVYGWEPINCCHSSWHHVHPSDHSIGCPSYLPSLPIHHLFHSIVLPSPSNAKVELLIPQVTCSDKQCEIQNNEPPIGDGLRDINTTYLGWFTNTDLTDLPFGSQSPESQFYHTISVSTSQPNLGEGCTMSDRSPWKRMYWTSSRAGFEQNATAKTCHQELLILWRTRRTRLDLYAWSKVQITRQTSGLYQSQVMATIVRPL